MSGNLTRAKVEQVAAFKVESACLAVGGVMKPVQLHQGINLVQAGVVEVQVQAQEQIIAALAIDTEVVAERAESLECAVTGMAKALPHAQIGFQRERSRILHHLPAAGGNIEVEAHRG